MHIWAQPSQIDARLDAFWRELAVFDGSWRELAVFDGLVKLEHLFYA